MIEISGEKLFKNTNGTRGNYFLLERLYKLVNSKIKLTNNRKIEIIIFFIKFWFYENKLKDTGILISDCHSKKIMEDTLEKFGKLNNKSEESNKNLLELEHKVFPFLFFNNEGKFKTDLWITIVFDLQRYLNESKFYYEESLKKYYLHKACGVRLKGAYINPNTL